ncbi:HAMP domain-containing sensor histidine kinase [Brevibacillus sp. NRS-1366]|uniref:HAMP domain-containing sensor histidine kinase n=1 Tax=Brevibacillus sp. NRS-1366 TaxID=3233899 RepID=UPI003D19903F
MRRKQDRSWKSFFLKVFALIAFFLVIALCWSLAYGATDFFYNKVGVHPSDYLSGIVNTVLSFLFFFLFAVIIRIKKPNQFDLFDAFYEAINRIAKGDFNVNLDIKLKHQWGELIEGFNHMAEQLNQMEQMKQEFISNVSHEIQSPLTSISGFARALHNEQLTHEERLHYLEIIETESKRLSKLSDNLLRLTSLEAVQHPLQHKRYRLDLQIRGIILACEPQWLERGIEMEVDLEKTEMEADEDMLSQVWMNLISNGIKFTPAKGMITIRLRCEGNEVVVQVADTGIGISEEDQGRVFERFFKADKSRNRGVSGSGLGLSIVQKIIDMHHGSIAVSSQLHAGTTFTVRLPRGTVAQVGKRSL